jgi:hypothetical protein
MGATIETKALADLSLRDAELQLPGGPPETEQRLFHGFRASIKPARVAEFEGLRRFSGRPDGLHFHCRGTLKGHGSLLKRLQQRQFAEIISVMGGIIPGGKSFLNRQSLTQHPVYCLIDPSNLFSQNMLAFFSGVDQACAPLLKLHCVDAAHRVVLSPFSTYFFPQVAKKIADGVFLITLKIY